jgi:hypothetical protein
MRKLIPVTILLFAGILSAQTVLSGSLTDMTLNRSGNPFIVADNLTVPEGTSLIIQEGCLFLFKPFSGIIVDGSIQVQGTLESPVIFTTENDSKYNPESRQLPNPFDWNGILVNDKARTVKLSNFILEYSVYGIKSLKEEFVINNGTFSRNGQFHVTVKDEIKPVIEDIPFNLGASSDSQKNNKGESAKPAGESGNSTDSSPKWVKPVALATSITGGVTLGTGVFFFGRVIYSYYRYIDLDEQEKSSFRNKFNSSWTPALVFSISGGVLLATGVSVYVWDKSKTRVSLSPVIGDGCGVMVSMEIPGRE